MSETFGARLKRLRLTRHMTTPQLADACCASSYLIINQWECDRCHPRVALLPLVARALNVTTDYLLTGRDPDDALRRAILRGEPQERLLAMARREI